MSDTPLPGIQLDAYVEWVRSLRTSGLKARAARPQPDPLARLSDELELLTAAMARRERELARLFDIVGTMSRSFSLEEVLEQIFGGFRDIIPFDRIGCALLSDDGHTLRARWAKSELGPVEIASGYSQPIAGSSLEQILHTGQPRILNDLLAYLEAKPDSDSTRRIVQEGGRSSLTCPLVLDGVPLGFLFFTSRETQAYAGSHQSLYRQIASQVAIVIQRSRLYDELMEQNRSLVERTHALHVVATTDPLTNLLNRRAMDSWLAAAWDRYLKDRQPFGVLMCDIDGFKAVNDQYGHEVGDHVLKAAASRLKSAARQNDLVGRVGGEEFLVVVADCATRDALWQVAERLRSSVQDGGVDIPLVAGVTASVGGALSAGHEGVADVVRSADAALFAAKRGGRNRVVVDERPPRPEPPPTPA